MIRTMRITNTMRGRSSRAFTLTEILVALVLMSVSMTAIMQLWSTFRSTTARSRDTSGYYVVARQEMEGARKQGLALSDMGSTKTLLSGMISRGSSVVSTSHDSTGYGEINEVRTGDSTSVVSTYYDSTGKPIGSVVRTDYDWAGKPIAFDGKTAFYRAKSTYVLDALQNLGTQVVEVFSRNPEGEFITDKPGYRTFAFISEGGV